ncbi:uncharacterized protein FIBRA_04132 [Fibroporia radiculosa]|uniref:DUF642 domain-containing protein n=1 Tax=Fibroporia radiculosa TaxID=599839 RepID=J4IA02_9APHY|nr:uncharacterized protein FIBRA_04132 [Fibroporia radiculosa]CCM02056.1 predicted protein [Fibroporia radiculosa]
MRTPLPSIISSSTIVLILVWWFIPLVKADYWEVTSPTSGVEWVNGRANLLAWSKGLLDGIDMFDIEMQRLSVAGVSFVAHNVPSSMSSLNVYLQDVPVGNDYYISFMNLTDGALWASSAAFAISNSANATLPSSDGSAPTVTISGAPAPTDQFAISFAATSDGGMSPKAMQTAGVILTVAACALSGMLIHL